MDENMLIQNDQHCFVWGWSSVRNLIAFFEKVIDEDRAMGIAYVDFSKIFDKVHHGRLIQNACDPQ